MDETAMERLLKEVGWTYIPRIRYHQTYAYASRRYGRKKREVYLGKLETLTPEKVLAKIAEAQK